MESSLQSFELIAELALALVGFAGVAAAFGGAAREFRPTERERYVGLFFYAGVSLAGSLTVVVCSSAGLAESEVFRVASIVSLAGVLGVLPRHRLAYLAARTPDSSSERWALYLTTASIIALLLVYAGNALVLASPWPLSAGYSMQLLLGVWLFFRILFRAN